MSLDWVTNCLKRATSKVETAPGPSPSSADATGEVLAEIKRQRDGWIEKAADGSRTILALRTDVARLMAERDAAWREIESLRSSLSFRAASAAVGADDLGSWSGLKEGR